MEYLYKQNDIVHYRVDSLLKGKAKVVGVTVSSVVPTYILEDLSNNIPNDTYKYTHFGCFETWMSKEPM